MEGGVTVFLLLLILVGGGIGGFLLFGAGGYMRKKQLDPERKADGGDRPEHLHVEDDAEAVMNMPPPGPTRANPSE
jgi:hypothetical protein